jgi:hypothetical protein
MGHPGIGLNRDRLLSYPILGFFFLHFLTWAFLRSGFRAKNNPEMTPEEERRSGDSV